MADENASEVDFYDQLTRDDQVLFLKDRIKALETTHFQMTVVVGDIEAGIYNPMEVTREQDETVEQALERSLAERRQIVAGLEKAILSAREQYAALRATPRLPRDRQKPKSKARANGRS